MLSHGGNTPTRNEIKIEAEFVSTFSIIEYCKTGIVLTGRDLMSNRCINMYA